MSGEGRRLDLHVHSLFSPDGRSTVESLVARAAATGLGGFALTDHNSVAGHGALASAQGRFPDLVLVAGVEVSTRDGHLLAYGVASAPPPGRPLAETLAWVRDRGGEAVVAHPFRRPHGAARALGGDLSAAVETINGHTLHGTNLRAAELARNGRRVGTGGSDAHAASELGRAWTVVPEGARSAAEVVEALRRGAVQPGGQDLGVGGWLAWALRTGGNRLRRGLRPL